MTKKWRHIGLRFVDYVVPAPVTWVLVLVLCLDRVGGMPTRDITLFYPRSENQLVPKKLTTT